MAKSVFRSALLFLASVALSFLIGEVFVRVFVPQRLDNSLSLYDPDEGLVFLMKKNFTGTHTSSEFEVPVITNSDGFRDREVGQKSRGTKRIIGLGDSFTFANGVALEDTYLKQLESCLATGSSSRTRVINCAVPAFSPLQEFLLWKRHAERWDPEIVLVGFFVGNDFVESLDLFDADGLPNLSVSNGALVSRKESDEERGFVRKTTRPIRLFLSTRSHLYVFLRNRLTQLISKAGLQALNLPPDFCARQYSDRMREGWALTQRIFVQMSSFAHEHGQRLVVVVLPTNYQVYENLWEESLSTLHLDRTQYDLNKPQKLLADFFVQHNIEWVDTLPELRAQATTSDLFYVVDGHPTRSGHRVIAQVLCSYFTQHP